ncbi:MAG: HNH endonuclease [Ferrovibrio sp.]|uniref:HNH endonuclease n=1 Tax=Ferrovibrio sp. TaxID=1917215 RepID=UPI003919B920
MSSRQSKLAGPALTKRYEILSQVQASIGDPRITIGTKGKCRYCGTDTPSLFRRQSHTFPEALGNKWVFSSDECDQCNSGIFARYDDSLANCVAPVLTLGGTKGKRNIIR